MNKSGVVAYVGQRNVKGQDLHSFTLKGVDGFFNCNTTNPNVLKGEFISFDAEAGDNGNYVVNVSTISRSGGSSASASSGRSFRTSSSTISGTNSKDKYWEDKEQRDIQTQKIIQLQASRNSAIALASAILQAGAIPGYAKAKDSDKAELICSYVDHLTEQFQGQVAASKNVSADVTAVLPTNSESKAEDSGKWE